MSAHMASKHLIIGITGATGVQIAVELLRAMRDHPEWETHLVISRGGRRTLAEETPFPLEEVKALATHYHPLDDIGASIASGTFTTEGMVVVPCSMKTVAGIASGFSQTLLLRAADVVIKERRKLVLVARESPLSPVHLKNLLELSRLGAIILPPMLTFYNHPLTVEDMVTHVAGRIMDVFGLELKGFRRWKEVVEMPEDSRDC
ncbi:MAG: UbiX family flavin prenyltransferase [Terriglobales bacterium]